MAEGDTKLPGITAGSWESTPHWLPRSLFRGVCSHRWGSGPPASRTQRASYGNYNSESPYQSHSARCHICCSPTVFGQRMLYHFHGSPSGITPAMLPARLERQPPRGLILIRRSSKPPIVTLISDLQEGSNEVLLRRSHKQPQRKTSRAIYVP